MEYITPFQENRSNFKILYRIIETRLIITRPASLSHHHILKDALLRPAKLLGIDKPLILYDVGLAFSLTA